MARDGVPVSARTRGASVSSCVVLLLALPGWSKARSSRLVRTRTVRWGMMVDGRSGKECVLEWVVEVKTAGEAGR